MAEQTPCRRFALRSESRVRGDEVERIVRVDPQRYGVVRWTEIVTVAFVPVFAIADRDELRQIVVERAEPVVDPGTECRKVAVVLMTSGVELRLRTVVAVGGPHRTHDRQLIDLPGDVREPIADFDAALAVLLETNLQRIEHIALIAVAVGNDQAFDGQAVLGSCVSAKGVSAIVLPRIW